MPGQLPSNYQPGNVGLVSGGGGSTPGRAYAVTVGADGAEELVALTDDGAVRAETYAEKETEAA